MDVCVVGNGFAENPESSGPKVAVVRQAVEEFLGDGTEAKERPDSVCADDLLHDPQHGDQAVGATLPRGRQLQIGVECALTT